MSLLATGTTAKSLQLCLTLCDPIDRSPPGSAIPGILQARTLEWVAISFSNAWKWKMKVKSLSRVWLLVTSWTVAHQAPPSMGISQARVLEWGAIAFSPGSLLLSIKSYMFYLHPTNRGDGKKLIQNNNTHISNALLYNAILYLHAFEHVIPIKNISSFLLCLVLLIYSASEFIRLL